MKRKEAKEKAERKQRKKEERDENIYKIKAIYHIHKRIYFEYIFKIIIECPIEFSHNSKSKSEE
ncbi:hypothetical protein [Methanolapillus millepedarum]|uniref:hypothetical protein n=1 Tax=Methanolapillus millepedarum TaxID=3028296 RepID=UPI0030B869BA